MKRPATIPCFRCGGLFITAAGKSSHRCKKGVAPSRNIFAIRLLFTPWCLGNFSFHFLHTLGAPRIQRGRVVRSSSGDGVSDIHRQRQPSTNSERGLQRRRGRPKRILSVRQRFAIKKKQNAAAYLRRKAVAP